MSAVTVTVHTSGRPLYALPISRDILQLFFKLTQSHVMARHHASVESLDDGNVLRIGGINGVLVTWQGENEGAGN